MAVINDMELYFAVWRIGFDVVAVGILAAACVLALWLAIKALVGIADWLIERMNRW